MKPEPLGLHETALNALQGPKMKPLNIALHAAFDYAVATGKSPFHPDARRWGAIFAISRQPFFM